MNNSVGNKAKSNTENDPRNLAPTISNGRMGLVASSSIVPVLYSSEKDRIVIAGTTIINTHGAMMKNDSSEACPASNTFVSPGNTQRNKPLSRRNMDTTT